MYLVPAPTFKWRYPDLVSSQLSSLQQGPGLLSGAAEHAWNISFLLETPHSDPEARERAPFYVEEQQLYSEILVKLKKLEPQTVNFGITPYYKKVSIKTHLCAADRGPASGPRDWLKEIRVKNGG